LDEVVWYVIAAHEIEIASVDRTADDDDRVVAAGSLLHDIREVGVYLTEAVEVAGHERVAPTTNLAPQRAKALRAKVRGHQLQLAVEVADAGWRDGAGRRNAMVVHSRSAVDHIVAATDRRSARAS